MASPARTAALGKFLVAAAGSFVESKDGARQRGSGPSGKRKRLHVLYILHDVLYHAQKRHPGNDDFGRNLEEHLAPLFSNISAFPGALKHTARILDLLAFWEESSLLSPGTISSLRGLVENAGANGMPPSKNTPQGAVSTAGKPSKEAPFTLPPTHGDSSLAWFDLPAANWLPHLAPNSTKPMKPDMIKPLQFAQGPADKAVVEAVKSLLSRVDLLFAKERKWDEHSDLSEMGERVVLDEVTGEIVGGETYYGWSRAFCKKMKDRHSKPQDHRGRSRSRSDSSASPPHHKRRRLSHSYSRSRSRTSSPHRRAERPLGGSRSRSPERHRRFRSPSRRRSRSRTPSPSRHRTERRYRRSPSPRNDGMAGKAPFYPPPPPVPHQQVPYQQPPILPHQIPPPPLGYTGPWPPPPPPPAFPSGGFPPSQGWPGTPGAPPGGQQFSHGRGGYGGDYGRGRGWGW